MSGTETYDRHPITGRFLAYDCEVDCQTACWGACGAAPLTEDDDE